ncbi:MAG TPA: nuclease-related domain-containing protein [Phycisphaerales bacterium]|nr:nuclease-related domain-containing protein [Phycisphaerales bacterium]
MIPLPFDPSRPADANAARGHAAEQQLAHDLGRAFADAPDIHIYHGLRFPAPRTSSDNDHTQIDHLIVHRHGMVIVESKATGSDYGVLHVDRHDQWTRCPGGNTRRGINMPSPIEQAKRQAESLRLLLQNAEPPLLDKMLGMLQQGFKHFPIVTLVALANNARVEGPGAKAHEGTVMKAEKVVERVRQEVESHSRRAGVLGALRSALANEDLNDDRGIYNLSDAALARIKYHLLKVHTPPHRISPDEADELNSADKEAARPRGVRPGIVEPAAAFLPGGRETVTAPRQATPQREHRPEALTCRHCRSINVQPVYRRDYCLLCDECGKYTPLSRVCTQCGNPHATIHKRGGEFYRACPPYSEAAKGGCGAEVVFWTS